MLMALGVIAVNAEVIIFTDCAMPPCFHVMFTLIACINKAILPLGVQLHKHAQGGPLGAPQRRKLPVLVPRQREEGIPTIHQVTTEQWVGVHDGGQGVDDWPSVQVNYKEDLFMLLHCGVQLLRQII